MNMPQSQFFFLFYLLLSFVATITVEARCDDLSEVFGKEMVEIHGCEEFAAQLGKEAIPMVLRKKDRVISEKWHAFAKKLEASELKNSKLRIKLSTANSYTGREYVETTVGAYLEQEESTRWSEGGNKRNRLGNETYYLFGNHYGEDWEQFLSNYPEVKHTFDCIKTWNNSFSLSFGLSGYDLGVAFHFHGPGFLEMLKGGKKWLTYKDSALFKEKFNFDPNVTSIDWYQSNKHLPQFKDVVFETNLFEGDILYFPNLWPHATISLDQYNVWISSFN